MLVKPKETRDPLPEGLQHAVVVAIRELGLQPGFNGEGAREECAIAFEFEVVDELHNRQRRVKWERFGVTTHPKSRLFKLVTATGLPIDMSREFSLDIIIGSNVGVLIDHVEKDGRTFANASGFTKLPKGTPMATPSRRESEYTLPDHLVEVERRRLDRAGAQANPQAQAAKPKGLKLPPQDDISGWVGPKLTKEEHDAAMEAADEADKSAREYAALEERPGR